MPTHVTTHVCLVEIRMGARTHAHFPHLQAEEEAAAAEAKAKADAAAAAAAAAAAKPAEAEKPADAAEQSLEVCACMAEGGGVGSLWGSRCASACWKCELFPLAAVSKKSSRLQNGFVLVLSVCRVDAEVQRLPQDLAKCSACVRYVYGMPT